MGAPVFRVSVRIDTEGMKETGLLKEGDFPLDPLPPPAVIDERQERGSAFIPSPGLLVIQSPNPLRIDNAAMVTIIDYGIGNLRSIEKAFEQMRVEVLRTDRPTDLAQAERLVLPGVGAFGACIREIRRRHLEDPIREAVQAGTPLLGVCVGMQLLFETGEERGTHRGLELLPGRVVHFHRADALSAASPSSNGRSEPSSQELKVPHMGWNTITPARESPLLKDIAPGTYFYFVHSYRALPVRSDDVLATATYGGPFPAIVGHENIYGVQFHPEKSQHAGLRLLKNFAELPALTTDPSESEG